MEKILFKDLSFIVNGILFKTHRDLGIYRSEKQYGDFFEKLLIEKNIKHIREYKFEDQQYGQNKIRCICDFIIDDKIILEFKTKNYLTKEDYFQTKRYLVTLNLQLALIINFRQTRLSPKRILNIIHENKFVDSDINS